MCMFEIYLHICSSGGVLLALAISPWSPAPSSARCDTVKTSPTKALPLFRYYKIQTILGYLNKKTPTSCLILFYYSKNIIGCFTCNDTAINTFIQSRGKRGTAKTYNVCHNVCQTRITL